MVFCKAPFRGAVASAAAATAAAISFSPLTARAQAASQTQVVPVQVSYYEVGQIPVTVERINAFHLPTGFHIAKFAEIQNPRIIAVAPDGTVNVTSVGFNRQALLDALQNHVLAKGEIVGTYRRTPDVRDKP